MHYKINIEHGTKNAVRKGVRASERASEMEMRRKKTQNFQKTK